MATLALKGSNEYTCVRKAYIAHTNIQKNKQKVVDFLNIVATGEFYSRLFQFYKKTSNMAQVCLNIVATGRGKGKSERRKQKAERRLAKLDELKQTVVYLGYTEYIQKNEERGGGNSFAAVNRSTAAGESQRSCW